MQGIVALDVEVEQQQIRLGGLHGAGCVREVVGFPNPLVAGAVVEELAQAVTEELVVLDDEGATGRLLGHGPPK